MQTPILALLAPSTSNQSTSLFRYIQFSCTNNGSAWKNNASDVCVQVPYAGTFSNLVVRCPTVLTAGTLDIGLMAASSIAGLGSYSPTLTTHFTTTSGTIVHDDNPAHNVTVAAGDWVCFQYAPGGGNINAPQISVVFTSTATGKSCIFLSHQSSSGSGQFLGLGGYSPTSGTSTNFQVVMPTAGTITSINAYRPTALTGGFAITYTLVRVSPSGADVGAVTITDPAKSNTAPGLTIAVAENDIYVIRQDSTGAAVASTGMISLGWEPTVDGEALAFGIDSPSGVSTSAVNYGPASGNGTGLNTSSANNYNIAPVNLTLKKLHAITTTAPGAGKTRIVKMLANDNPLSPSLTATLTGTTSPATIADNSNTPSVLADDLINWSTDPNGTGPAASTGSAISFVMTVGGAPAVRTPTMTLTGVG